MEWNLSAVELRVLGSFIEKEATTPDQYPLSINALCSACNQKSNRDPVMELDESAVREAIGALTLRGLVRTASGYGGRVSKYAHRFGTAGAGLELSPDQIALLCVLFLRGAQTPGELRARSQRLHAFADTEAVQATLTALEQHPEGPLVRCLPRLPGKREHRYIHCFGTAADAAAVAEASVAHGAPEAASAAAPQSVDKDLEARVVALEEAMAALERRLAAIDGEGAERDDGDAQGDGHERT